MLGDGRPDPACNYAACCYDGADYEGERTRHCLQLHTGRVRTLTFHMIQETRRQSQATC